MSVLPGTYLHSRYVKAIFWTALVVSSSFFTGTLAATPTILSSNTSTRAIALEAATLKPEPFPLQASVQYSTDLRTRIVVFMLNLDMLPGEGASSFTADGQDSTNAIYPFTVESVNPV